jgi:hypothetical protein
MTDPQWPQGPDPRRSGWQPPPSEPTGDQNTGYPDPAYAGQFSYPSYTPPPGSGPTRELPPYWTQTQYPHGGDQQMAPPPPEPPRSPRWLWFLAGAAVLLVIGLVVALVIANGNSKQESAVSPLPPMPSSSAPTTTRVPPRITTTLPTIPAPPGVTTTAPTGQEQTVVYSVTGQGRAISITYVDTGGILNMEFNVALPWTKEVTLSPPASTAASVTVLNVGNDVTCTVTVDGENVRERTGTGLTICAAAG